MTLLLISFLAGILTILAPCVLPVLPVIIGGSLEDKSPLRPLIITLSLGLSIILFTLLLKASTLLISVPDSFWKSISGGIVIFFGLTLLFPNLWSIIETKLHFGTGSQKALQNANQKKGIGGMIALGMALGPVFASCSPTYFVILATVLPASFAQGVIYLFAYALGLALILFLVAALGQRFIAGARWAADPNGWFKKSLGIFLILVGVAVFSGLDKAAETWLLDNGFYKAGQLEEQLLEKAGIE